MERRRGSSAHEVEYGELPEITRGLRALGSPRHSGGLLRVGGATSRMHQQFFHPLLEARRSAASARTPDAIVRAFDSDELTRALERVVERVVAEWPDERTPARRALRTGLRERTDEYARALAELKDRADAVLAAPEKERLIPWRAWTTQLVTTFHSADRSWIALQSVIDTLPPRSTR
jgi:hypothetical protein